MKAEDLDVEPLTPCCNKRMRMPKGAAMQSVIAWNPYNGVVQCHACGAIYVPAESDSVGVAVWSPVSPSIQKHMEDGTAPT